MDDEEDDDLDDRPRPRRRRRHDEDEEDSTGGLIPYKNPNALIAYYTAIFGFFLPLIGSIVAIVFGFKGMAYAREHPRARGQVHAMIGIVGGILGALFWLLCGGGMLIAELWKR